MTSCAILKPRLKVRKTKAERPTSETEVSKTRVHFFTDALAAER